MFKTKTADEILALTDVELVAYKEAESKHNAKVIADEFEKKFTELKNGTISKDEFKEHEKSLLETIKKTFDDNSKESLKDELAELKKSLLATQLELKNGVGSKPKAKGSLKSFLTSFFESDATKTYSENPNGKSKRYSEKTVSIASDYLGTTHLITGDSGRRIVQPERPINMRDIMSVEQSDMPYIAFAEITGFVNAIDMLTENQTLPESSFDVKETTVMAKRLGTFIDISKNMLKSVTWVISRIMNILPAKMRWIEDFQILWGDGAGDNLDGLMKNARTFDGADVSFIAGDIASVASYNGGTDSIVTFTAAHNLYNGYSITFALSTNYNANYKFVVKSATQILVLGATYVAEATAAWTATAIHSFKDAVSSANYYDALKVALSDMRTQWYMATGIVMNPLTATNIEMLKSTTAEYLGVIERRNGTLYINNVPVVETDAMTIGKALIGDFNLATSLVDYQELEIYMADDVSYIKKNQVAIIVEEQVMLPIFNSLMFINCDLDAIVAVIDKP